jgi:hypothetical protein
VPTKDRTDRLAVLIDADNASAKIADGLFEEIAKIGKASVRRIYGNFASSNLKPWTDILTKHALTPHQQFANTVGKNASDIALVIDAMDLLHRGGFDGFCLVSSDSDFTRLASRIREDVSVYGFGEKKTPESFRQACDRFVYTENLLPKPAVATDSVEEPKRLEPIGKAVTLLRGIVQSIEDEDGWATLGEVGSLLIRQEPDFDPRSYGFKKLSDLVRGRSEFDVGTSPTNVLRVRTRKAAKKAAKAR